MPAVDAALTDLIDTVSRQRSEGSGLLPRNRFQALDACLTGEKRHAMRPVVGLICQALYCD